MAPNGKKRKAENAADADGADGGVERAPNKKSKRERLAEAKRKAKAWHDSRNSGGATGAGAARPSPRPSSARKASAPESRRRTARSRKSTGGIGASRGTAPAGSGRRGRASVGGGATFEFAPPASAKEEKSSDEEASDEEEEGEEHDEERRLRDAAVQSVGPASKIPSGRRLKPAYEFEAGARSKEREGRGGSRAAAEMRVDGERPGPQRAGDQNASDRNRQPRRSLQKDYFDMPLDSGERKVPPEAMKSPDPPSTTLLTVAEEDRPSANNSKLPRLAAASSQRVGNSLPPSVRPILTSKPRTTAHQPHRQKFNSDRPYTTSGQSPPPVAYCGSGPTPSGPRDRSVRDVVGAVDGASDQRTANSAASAPAPGGSSWGSARLKSPVDPPHKKMYSGGSGDERKIPSRPSPPGNDAGGREGGVGGNGDASVAAAPAPPAPAEVHDAGALGAAMARARGMVSSAAASNRLRRAMMGIRSPRDDQKATDDTSINASAHKVGIPPRDIIRTERPADSAVEDEKMQLDPPGSPPSPAAPQRKYREAGPDQASAEGKDEKGPDGNSAILSTDAGEATSEAGRNLAGRISPETNDLSPKNKKSSFLKSACTSLLIYSLFAQLVFGFIYLVTKGPTYKLADVSATFGGKEKETKPAATPQEDSSPCFFDYPAENEDDEGDSITDHVCKGVYEQCPPQGRCKGGALISCDGGDGIYEGTSNLRLFVPDDNGHKCVISPEANDLVAAVQNTLVNMTVTQTCGLSVNIKGGNNVLLMEGDEFPLFRLAKLAEKMKDGHAECYDAPWSISSDLLLWLSPAFDPGLVRFASLPGDDGDDFDAIGLGTSVPPNSLELPFDCTMKLLFWEALEFIGSCFFTALMFLMKKTWILVTTHPFYAFCFVAIWKLVAMVRSKRKDRAKVLELLPVVLEKAYDRLSECDDNDGYAALYLRDDVARDIYLTDFRGRQFLIDHVWPRILLEVRADNRVRKFRRIANDGKELEHWDFDTQSKKGRRLRKSTGTTNGRREP